MGISYDKMLKLFQGKGYHKLHDEKRKNHRAGNLEEDSGGRKH